MYIYIYGVVIHIHRSSYFGLNRKGELTHRQKHREHLKGWKEKPSCSKRVPLGIIEHILRRTPIQPSLIYINRTEMWKTPSFVDQSPKGKPYVTMSFPQPF